MYLVRRERVPELIVPNDKLQRRRNKKKKHYDNLGDCDQNESYTITAIETSEVSQRP